MYFFSFSTDGSVYSSKHVTLPTSATKRKRRDAEDENIVITVGKQTSCTFPANPNVECDKPLQPGKEYR